jgi:5-hydroxyisourate hydrolase-like protein (transthyretin family)
MTRIRLTRMAILCLFVFAVLVAAAPAFAAPPNPVVSGTLYGSDGVTITDGQVVVNHLVKGVWQPMLTLSTANAGKWTFTAKADDLRLDFSAPFADPQTRYLTTVRGSTYVVDVTLQAYGAISGTITDATGGGGIGDASVELFKRNSDGSWPSTPFATVTANSSGGYSVSSLPCGSYAVKASATSCISAFLGGATIDGATPAAVTRGSTSSASFALQSLGEIGGTITDSVSGMPLGGASVEIYRRNGDGTWTLAETLATEPDGTFASGQIYTGIWTVKAVAPDHYDGFHGGGATPDTAEWIGLTRGAVVSADIALIPVPPDNGTGTISGRVVQGASETPLAGVYVYLYRQNDDGTWPPTTPGWGSPTFTLFTDSLGQYASGPLPYGNYKIRFFHWHLGSQWWQYVPTVDLATVVSITYDGQAYTGIDGWYNKP